MHGRAGAQVRVIRQVTERYRRATMATLRIAFISSLALELLATLGTALVAVAVGLRLLGGDLGYRPALLAFRRFGNFARKPGVHRLFAA